MIPPVPLVAKTLDVAADLLADRVFGGAGYYGGYNGTCAKAGRPEQAHYRCKGWVYSAELHAFVRTTIHAYATPRSLWAKCLRDRVLYEDFTGLLCAKRKVHGKWYYWRLVVANDR